MIERIIIKNFKGIKEADISFHDKINVIVGNNGVGKSTLIEAISLTLGHGIGQLEITQYLFHESTWKDFESNKVLPEIIIELYFNKDFSDYPFMHLLYSQLLVCQRVCLQNTVCLICK